MATSEGERRHRIRERAGGVCEYCRLADLLLEAGTVFEVEHIKPRESFLPNDPAVDSDDNLAWSCPRCNRLKGTRTDGVDPHDGTLYRLFNPRIDHWEEHFIALPSGRIEGVTAIGRVTVEALGFNRYPARVAAREKLNALGEWPQ